MFRVLVLTVLFVLNYAVELKAKAQGSETGNSVVIDQQKTDVADSYFVAMLANLDCWHRGDFLVKEDYFFDSVKISHEGPVGLLVKESSLTRFFFDYRKQKYSIFKMIVKDQTYFDGKELPQNDVKESVIAATFDLQTAKLRYSSEEGKWVASLGHERIRDILKTGLFPDYRTAGFEGFHFKSTDFQTMREDLEWRRSGVGLESVSTTDEAVSLYYRYRLGNDMPNVPGEKFVVAIVDFDVESLMPKRFEERIVTSRFENVTREVRTKWNLLDDIYVPTLISMNKPDSYQVNGVAHRAIAEKDMVFHWFSINGDEFDDDMFDGSRMTSAKAIYQMVDPVANNATSLLPKEKK